MVKQEMISGPFQEPHLPSPRWTESQTVRAERSIILNSTEIFRRDQGYKNVTGCNAGEKHRRFIGTLVGTETCQIRGKASLGSRYLDEKPRDGCAWSGRRLTRKQTTSRPASLWPEMWKDMSEASQRKEQREWAIEKPKLDNARKLRGIYFMDPAGEEFLKKKKTFQKCAEKVGSSDASSNALQDQRTRVQGDL